MSTNPYEPPLSISDESAIDRDAAGRNAARRCVRYALLILIVPAFANLLFYHFTGRIASVGRPLQLAIFGANGLGVLLIAAAVWFLGLEVFEFFTGGLFTVFAKNSVLRIWLDALYETLQRVPKLAFCGAVVWFVWLIGLHVIGMSFMAISVPVGLAAHLFAAAFYLPLIRNWYRAEKSAQLD